MDVRTVTTAFGATITTFQVVAVPVIELLNLGFSAIAGLPVGPMAGAGVLVAVLVSHEDVGEPVRWALAGLAGFGHAGLAVARGRLREPRRTPVVDTVERTVGVAVVVGSLAGIGKWFGDRNSRTDGDRDPTE